MENVFTREQLNEYSREQLIGLVMQLSEQITELNRKTDILLEQMAAMNRSRFGQKTETFLSEQICMFNEAEALSDKSVPEEDISEIVPSYTRKKRSGKREDDLSGFPVEVVEHRLSEEELKNEFPDGCTRLPDEIYRKLEYTPASHRVIEHHLSVYKDKRDGHIVKAAHPIEMLDRSIATPSLAAGIMNGKYTNAMPLYRIEQELERNDVHISRQTMANWMIVLSERYLSLVYDRMKEEIRKSPVIHADETPVLVTKDGRDGMHKNYMWVYRTGEMCKSNASVIYDFQRTRRQDHPREFLSGFKGKLVCDGYQVYHGLEKEDGSEFAVAGCWAHARRPFAEVVMRLGDKAGGTVAYEALARISEIYHTDNALHKLPPSERKKKRKTVVRPLVDDFFEWAKKAVITVAPGGKTAEGLQYCLNQEKYLRVFLEDPQIPMDNNAAERAIRSFCVGRNNWKLIDTVNGAQASAMIYSIVETAKANNLKIYEYLKLLLTEIPKHMDDHSLDFLEDLMPWSAELPEECRKKNS